MKRPGDKVAAAVLKGVDFVLGLLPYKWENYVRRNAKAIGAFVSAPVANAILTHGLHLDNNVITTDLGKINIANVLTGVITAAIVWILSNDPTAGTPEPEPQPVVGEQP